MIGPGLPRTALLAVSLALATAGLPLATMAQTVDAGSAPAPAPALDQRFVAWVAASRDNNGLPFVIIDKTAAVISVYDPAGALIGTEPALVGAALGDESTPGIGDRELRTIKPEERTTPAGRFVAAYGPARGKEKVLWVDYSTGVSLHAVITTNPSERRLQRLQSPAPEDNRITFGCINVSAEFYKTVVSANLTDRAIVYVLPDSKPVAEVFPSFGLYANRTASVAAQSQPTL